ncbi:unnamed protein product [Ascophyllum nodosum]
MARFVFFVTCGILVGAKATLTVITPAEDDIVIADRTYTVEWVDSSDSRFEIDLYFCGSMCMEDECGEWVTALCPYAETGCPDNEGDYDVVMPEPLSGLSGSGYKVRVADVNDEESADCSDDFFLLASEEAPDVGDADGPTIEVTSPDDGDVAMAGDEYTVEWDYDNGVGSRVDRFAIDLYMSSGDGDCGTYVVTLCDKPEIGCKDSMGDYDVTIPEDTMSGMYKIRVGPFEEEDLFDCSGEFEIIGEDGDDGSMSFRF